MTVDPRTRELELALAAIWQAHMVAVSNGGGAWKRHVEPAIMEAARLLPIELRLRDRTSPSAPSDPYELRRKKMPCPHKEAQWDGNSDWPGLVCAACGKAVEEKDYE